ncbi:hypothetical protein BDN70DRAFT_873790 [Pholiota conissans]|uniref:Transmembrane protein n=1 Tax=Pholiota conissans TaxID=109636 RepID=A0A9P5Z9N4_9AGAR|nr:hypothetical protein BDN70DRAFT_873790 [Pholiota conissans]
MSRSILVDDTDPRIAYTGPWFTNTGSFDETGDSGPPLESTLHGTNDAASFSYDFSGTSVTVAGANQFSTNVSALVSWQCFVDSESIPVISFAPPPANRVPFCKKDGLADSNHTITVNATVTNQQTFFFDYIQYVPSATVPLDQTSIAVNWTDPQLIFSGTWDFNLPQGPSTIQDAATASFHFTGTSLAWYGFYANNTPFAFTRGSYTIDGGDVIYFPLNAESTVPRSGLLFFQTAVIPSGQHNITVQYHGNLHTTPLTLESLVIQNSAAPNISTSTGSTTGSPSSQSEAPSSHKSTHVGAIAGGVVGGVVAVFGVILLFVFWKGKHPSNDDIKIKDAEKHIQPFIPKEIVPIGGVDTKNPAKGSLIFQDPNPSPLSEVTGATSPLSLSPLRYQNTVNQIVSSRTESSNNSDAVTDSRQQDISEPTPHTSATVSLPAGPGPSEPPLAESDVQVANDAQADSSPTVAGPPNFASSLSHPYLPPGRVVVHEEDSGIRITGVDLHGNAVEVLPPVYTSG